MFSKTQFLSFYYCSKSCLFCFSICKIEGGSSWGACLLRKCYLGRVKSIIWHWVVSRASASKLHLTLWGRFLDISRSRPWHFGAGLASVNNRLTRILSLGNDFLLLCYDLDGLWRFTGKEFCFGSVNYLLSGKFGLWSVTRHRPRRVSGPLSTRGEQGVPTFPAECSPGGI